MGHNLKLCSCQSFSPGFVCHDLMIWLLSLQSDCKACLEDLEQNMQSEPKTKKRRGTGDQGAGDA